MTADPAWQHTAFDAARTFVERYGAAVGWWADSSTFGLLRATRSDDGMVTFDTADGAVTAAEQCVPLTLRLFNPRGDLTWADRPETGPVAAIRAAGEPPEGCRERSGEYARLLWGSVVSGGVDAGWAVTFHGRVGSLTVPLSDTAEVPAEGSRLAVYAVEYEQMDRHGNVSILGERMTRIGIYPTPTGSVPDE